MLIRIVKMKFNDNQIEDFKIVFETHKETIRQFEGCSFLALYQDKGDAATFFTYSYWDTEANLKAYRNSSFFKSVWGQTKKLFADKPEAWSVNEVHRLP